MSSSSGTIAVVVRCVVVVCVCCVWSVYGRARLETETDLLDRTLEATKKALGFFAEDYSSINVDGLFGMRLGQGQIVPAVEECKASDSCPSELQQELSLLNDGVEKAAKVAMEYTLADDPAYFERFEQTVSKPYLLQYRPTTFTDLDKTPPGSDESYDEEQGDRCFARTMGTYKEEDGRKVDRCNVTRSCWRLMTQEDRSRYSITHQLLYFIMIEKTDCVEEVEKSMGVRLQEFKDRMCGSIYNEALKEAKDGHVTELSQDLFLEQTLVCGVLGYEDFLRPDWMRMVLRWQMPSGCFSLENKGLLEMETMVSQFREEQRQLMNDLKMEAQMIEEQHQHYHTRKLLREKIMKDGCLSHKSGLGFGTLCLYVRYLIRQLYLPQ